MSANPSRDRPPLAAPHDDSPRPSLSTHWPRRSLSTQQPKTFRARLVRQARALHRKPDRQYRRLSLIQRALLITTGIATVVLGVLFLIFNEKIFGLLEPVAGRWRDLRGGWLILWLATFVVSFPPLIGYSTCVTAAGFVWGFPWGWFIVATATIVGSTCSFLLSRTLLKGWVERLVKDDTRFTALSLVLKHDGLKLLVMIRLCPLPYSISNGAISTIPTVQWAAFAIATTIASPKLLLHVFIGAQLARLGEGKMDAKTKAISWFSIILGLTAGVVTGWFMYRKTQARARELEEEQRQHVADETEDQLRAEYADDPDALEAAEHLREQADDISLRDAYIDDIEGGYLDTLDEEEREAELRDQVFHHGHCPTNTAARPRDH